MSKFTVFFSPEHTHVSLLLPFCSRGVPRGFHVAKPNGQFSVLKIKCSFQPLLQLTLFQDLHFTPCLSQWPLLFHLFVWFFSFPRSVSMGWELPGLSPLTSAYPCVWGDEPIQFHGFIYQPYAHNCQIHVCRPFPWIPATCLSLLLGYLICISDLTHWIRKQWISPQTSCSSPISLNDNSTFYTFRLHIMETSLISLLLLYPISNQSENILGLCPEFPLVPPWSKL